MTANTMLTKEAYDRVEAFDASTVTGERLVKSIIANGGVIIRNFIDIDTVKTIEQDVRPHIDADKPWSGEFFPKETRRARKSTTFVDSIVMNRLWLHLTHELLTSRHITWAGQSQHESVSKPQVSATIVFAIQPGAKDQVLHRDDGNSHNIIPEITEDQYAPARDDTIGLFVAGSKTTRQNGATRFVPRSHLQHTFTKPPDEAADPDCVVYAELDPGDAFMMLGSCYHGGSANKSVDEERLVFASFSTKGYLRQVSRNFLTEANTKSDRAIRTGGESIPRIVKGGGLII
jgi:ectoine hydroxylase-related dioxygenase (phytanoyl-CoA dioxygenase family)